MVPKNLPASTLNLFEGVLIIFFLNFFVIIIFFFFFFFGHPVAHGVPRPEIRSKLQLRPRL